MLTNATTIVRSPLLLLCGGFAAQHSRVPPSAEQCLWLFGLALTLLVFRRTRALALLVLGFVMFMQAGAKAVDARLDQKFEGDSMLVEVRIADFPRQNGMSVSLLLEAVDDVRMPRRSTASWYNPSRMPAYGDIWQLELRLRRPRGSSNPGVFSLENWMFRERLNARGYVVPGKRNRLLISAVLSPKEKMRRDFVDFAMRHGSESAPVLAAIGVGARHLISNDQWAGYANTGTSHLMAISGLHVGLAAAAVFALVAYAAGCARLRGNYINKGLICGVVIAFAYATISGFFVPSQRAVAMLGLVALAFVLRRRADPVRIIALTSMLMFFIDPLTLMKPGFALSFSAVLVLLWFAAMFRQTDQQPRTHSLLLRPLMQLINMQIVLLFALLPLTLVFFHRVALTAPLVNLISVPIFSFITVPATLLSLILFENFDTAAAVPLRLAAASVALIETLIERFSASVAGDVPIALADLNRGILILPALWVLLPNAWPGRNLGLLAGLAIMLYQPGGPPKRCFDMHVLDVGQGLSVVIQSQRRTMVFDTGASYRGGGSAARQVVLPFLRYRGVRSIDWLVVSHADNDHAGGVPALLEAVPVRTQFFGEVSATQGVDGRQCVAGDAWSGDGIDYRFLHPSSNALPEGNNASCVLSISSGDFRVLLTGDIEAPAERRLLTQSGINTADVVVIPHHGSLTSSTPALVSRLRPDIAIASAGFGNRWGFPKQRVTERWQSVGAVVLDTAASGAISLQLCANGGIRRLRLEREQGRRFWHD